MRSPQPEGGGGTVGGGGGVTRNLLTSYFYTEIHLGAIYSSENFQAGCIVGYCIYPRPSQDWAEGHSHSTVSHPTNWIS